MLTPQEKVVIVASRGKQRAVIETLYELQSAHIIEFHEGRDPHGLRFGRTLPEGSKASERLVRLRALVRALGLEGREPERTTPAAEIERRIDAALDALEVDVQASVETRDRVKGDLKELDDREARLRPLTALPLRLEDYTGYRSLRVLVGRATEPVSADEVGRAAPDALVFVGGDAVAAFVPHAQADAAQEALLRKGFRETEAPTGTGDVAEAIAEAGRERTRLAERLAKAQADIARLAAEHGDFLLAAEEHLSIEVEKAEAPLGFGSTEYTFVVQAWVPTTDVARVESALRAAVGEEFHLERAAPVMHGHGDGHHRKDEPGHTSPDGADAHTVPAEAHERHDGDDTPPTKYANPGFARPFQFFTTMFSTPRYGEIDPTVVLSITFPLFYGFMISDLGYGTIMAVLGLWMAFKLAKIEGMRELGIGIAVAGVVAMTFGGLVFYDAFGIPFFAHGEHAEEALHAADPCAAFAHEAGETTWSCLLTGSLVDHHAPLSKIGDVSTLLILSVLAALAHLGVGLLFGIANEVKHSMKHAAAKFGWLLLLLAFTYQVLSVARYNKFIGVKAWFPATEFPYGADGPHGVLNLAGLSLGSISVIGMEISYLFLALFGVGLVLLLATEGGIAILEIPSLLANLLSYTRLAGVAVAKAAMAAAFNALFLVGMVLGGKGIVIIVVGALLVVLTQSVVLVLGLLSSGIQAIRLNYVEFFTKFYKGGGTPFRPFGRTRRYSSSSQPTP